MSLDTSRRRVLAAGGSGLTALLAGCGAVPFIGDGDATIDSADWPMPAHDPQNTNQTTATLPADPTEQWRKTFKDGIGTPVVADGSTYLLSYDSNLTTDTDSSSGTSTVHVLDAATGEEQWSESLSESRKLGGQPAVGNDTLVYTTTADRSFDENTPPDSTLQARSADEGEQQWQIDAPDGSGWPRVVGDAVITAGTRDKQGWVGAFDVASGEQRWVEELDVGVQGLPATDSDVVVTHTGSGNVFALDFETGERRWTHFDNPAKSAFRSSSPALSEERVFTFRHHVSRGETTLHALTRDGEEDWHRTVLGGPAGVGSDMLGLTDERVLCLSKDLPGGESSRTTYLTALDRSSGEEQWQYTLSPSNAYKVRGLTLTEESALFAANDRLHVVSLEGEKRWERPLNVVGSRKPIVADGRLYLDVTGDDEETSTLAASE